MDSGDKDLLWKAKKLESEELTNIKFTPERVSSLDDLLLDAYAKQCPKPIDYFNRKDLVRIFNVIAKEVYGNGKSSPVVEEYGSFVMDMFTTGSDLDLSINFSSNSIEVPRQKKIETLRKFAKKLHSIQRRGHVRGVQTIITARVPIVKVTDCGTGIECDLSVDNRDGIVKSYIIHAISTIDERFRKLSFLMKSWAKAHDINSSKDRTLNSLSIVSLVAFHLQTRNPPILPPFSDLLKDGADPAAVMKVTNNYLNYGKKNRESLTELFITLFVKLASVEKLWQEGLCASLYKGSWISKSWDPRSYSLSVEDFTDPSQNFARVVGTEEVKEIYRCIHKSLKYFSDFLNGQMLGSKLIDLLFGRDTVSTRGQQDTGHKVENMNSPPILQNQHPPKRMRLMEGLEKNNVRKPNETNFVQGWQRAEPWKGSAEAPRADVLWGGTFQPPPIFSSDHKVHHGDVQWTVPSAFVRNPLGFERFYNPSLQFHQVVDPNPILGSVLSHLPQLSHNSQQGGPYYFNARN